MTRKLIVGNGRSEREVLLVGNITIGRDPACHISEPDPLLSRRHAEIVANVHGVSVRDLNSRNGLLVNGEKTREQVLMPGDVVQMGHLQVRYVEEQIRPAEGVASRGFDPRGQAPAPPPPPPQPSMPADHLDRFRPEPPSSRPSAQPTPQPGRWRPEPTPLPGRRSSAAPLPPQPRAQNHAPVPRGKAAFDDTVKVPRESIVPDPLDHTMLASHHDTTLGTGPAYLDATMVAPLPTDDPLGIKSWGNQDQTMLAGGVPESSDSTVTPGNETFAAALAHLAGLASPGNEQLAHKGPGARLVANSELTITDASPGCAELLGVPGEELIGDSLTDVFLRGVRRAYAESGSTLDLSIARGPRGSITVTLTLNQTGGIE